MRTPLAIIKPAASHQELHIINNKEFDFIDSSYLKEENIS
jgi:hypothetical protein